MTTADLQRIWETQIVERLRPVAAGLFREANVLAHDRNVVTVRLSEGVPVDQAQRRCNEVEAVLSEVLDQTVRLEVSGSGNVAGPASTAHDDAPPPPPVPAAPAEVASPPPSHDAAPAASAPEGGTAQQSETGSASASAVSQESVSQETGLSASSQESKVRQIVDRFPGSVVVHVDEGTT